MIQRKKKQDPVPDPEQVTIEEAVPAAPDAQDKAAIRAVEAIYSKTPLNSIYKTQDKISNLLPEIISSAETVPVEVETAPNSMVKVSIMSDKLLTPQGVSIFDRAVLDGITACILQNSTDGQIGIFTLPQLIRAVTGKKAGQSGTSDQQRDMFLESVKKLMTMYLEIDMSNEARSLSVDGKPVEQAVLSGNLFSAEMLKLKIGGHMTICFKPLAMPLLYRYALPKRQLYQHPIELLFNANISKTASVISIQEILLRHISMLFSMHRNKNFQNNGLLFETIYDAAGCYEVENKRSQQTRMRKARADVVAILDQWVEIKHILSYEFVQRGREFYKVVIQINPASKYKPKVVQEDEIQIPEAE